MASEIAITAAIKTETKDKSICSSKALMILVLWL